MKTLSNLLSIFTLLFIAACANQQSLQLAESDDDEFGIGGTGIMAGNQQGSGIIGMITGYGSIFVNGIEVETGNKASISIDGIKVKDHDFEIGEVVEVLSQDTKAHTQAQHINIRHEIIGPVSHYDSNQATAVILGQRIHLSETINSRVELGDRLAVSGFTDPRGLIHATHIRHITGNQILLRGAIQSDGKNLSLKNIPLSISLESLPDSKQSVVHGIYKNGVINPTEIMNDHILPFDKVAKWVIQGYSENYASQWNMDSKSLHTSGTYEPVVFEVTKPNSGSPIVNLLSQQKLSKGAGNKSLLRNRSIPSRSFQPGRQSGSGGHGRK
jgi:hypothetical protein